MFILHLALGGCLKSPPVHYGITADTGGHIAYILDAAAAQANNIDTHQVSIVTRLFEEPGLSLEHARATERLSPKLTIDRIATANRRYLEKEALADDLASFTEAFASISPGCRACPMSSTRISPTPPPSPPRRGGALPFPSSTRRMRWASTSAAITAPHPR